MHILALLQENIGEYGVAGTAVLAISGIALAAVKAALTKQKTECHIQCQGCGFDKECKKAILEATAGINTLVSRSDISETAKQVAEYLKLAQSAGGNK